MQKQYTQRAQEFDGLRGALAIWVAISHILCWTGFADYGRNLSGIFESGWEDFIYAQPAVDTFIILSGFAISSLLAENSTYRSFLANRIFRIYPVYLTCLALGYFASHLSPQIFSIASWHRTDYFTQLRSISLSEQKHAAAHLFAHISLLNGLIPRNALFNASATFLPPAWSITLEWQYYLVAPLIATMILSSRGLAALLLVSLLGGHFASIWNNPLPAFLPDRLPLFLIGIASYHLYRSNSRQMNSSATVSATLVMASLAAAIIANWHTLALSIWVLTFGSVVAHRGNRTATALESIRKLLLGRWIQGIGKMSYPLYLIHWPLIVISLWLMLKLKPDIPHSTALAWLLLGTLPAILLLAKAVHTYIERPALNYGKRFQHRQMQANTSEGRPSPSKASRSPLPDPQ